MPVVLAVASLVFHFWELLRGATTTVVWLKTRDQQ